MRVGTGAIHPFPKGNFCHNSKNASVSLYIETIFFFFGGGVTIYSYLTSYSYIERILFYLL